MSALRWSLAGALAVIVSPLALAQDATKSSFRELTEADLVAGINAINAKDYPKARDSFVQGLAKLDKKPFDQDNYQDRAVRAAFTYLLARAIGEGKLGDPCGALTAAQTLVDSAGKIAANNPGIDHGREVGTDATADIAKARTKFACVAPAASDPVTPAPRPMLAKPKPPAKFVGHYYLSGVREVGSEIILRADGTYDFFRSYGAVDEISNGQWAQVDDAIILENSPPAVDAPWFSLSTLAPWDVEAEDFVQMARFDDAERKIKQTCLFLDDSVVESATATIAPPVLPVKLDSDTDSTAPPPPDIDALKADEAKARLAYETAARAAMTAKKGKATRSSTAFLNRLDWEMTREALKPVLSPDEMPPAPELPVQCRLPEPIRTADLAEADWKRGFAVQVGDPKRGLSISNVDVIFHFADGEEPLRRTARRGIAVVEKRAGVDVTAISLAYRGEGREGAAFERYDIPDSSEGVQLVHFDVQRIVPPPFETLRLEIDGKELTGPGGRGQYSRAK